MKSAELKMHIRDKPALIGARNRDLYLEARFAFDLALPQRLRENGKHRSATSSFHLSGEYDATLVQHLLLKRKILSEDDGIDAK